MQGVTLAESRANYRRTGDLTAVCQPACSRVRQDGMNAVGLQGLLVVQ